MVSFIFEGGDSRLDCLRFLVHSGSLSGSQGYFLEFLLFSTQLPLKNVESILKGNSFSYLLLEKHFISSDGNYLPFIFNIIYLHGKAIVLFTIKMQVIVLQW